MDNAATVKSVVADAMSQLSPKYGHGEAQAMVRFMFENLKDWSAVDLVIHQEDTLSDYIVAEVGKVVGRLLDDEPIQLIFGVADFYGMKLKVTGATLIPRPETAELVDLIVKENQRKDLHVLDAGTGSGCIAIALARNLPFAEVTAIDLSRAALDVARENARQLHCQIDFEVADILQLPATLPGQPFDILVSNPPYITVKEKAEMDRNVLGYEPSSALFVPDDDPLRFYIPLLQAAVDGLVVPGGKIYFEINPLYADELKRQAVKLGLNDVNILRDSYGKNRFLSATVPQQA